MIDLKIETALLGSEGTHQKCVPSKLSIRLLPNVLSPCPRAFVPALPLPPAKRLGGKYPVRGDGGGLICCSGLSRLPLSHIPRQLPLTASLGEQVTTQGRATALGSTFHNGFSAFGVSPARTKSASKTAFLAELPHIFIHLYDTRT